MRKVSDYDICTKFMKNSGVKNSYQHVVHSHIGPEQNEEAIFHNPKPYICFCKALIPVFVFE